MFTDYTASTFHIHTLSLATPETRTTVTITHTLVTVGTQSHRPCSFTADDCPGSLITAAWGISRQCFQRPFLECRDGSASNVLAT